MFFIWALVLDGSQHLLFGLLNQVAYLMGKAPYQYERMTLGTLCLSMAYVLITQHTAGKETT